MNNNIVDELNSLIMRNNQLKNIFKKQKRQDSRCVFEGEYKINSKYEGMKYIVKPSIMINSDVDGICIKSEVLPSINHSNRLQLLDMINQINCETTTTKFFIDPAPDIIINGLRCECLNKDINALCFYYYENMEEQVFYNIIEDHFEAIDKYIQCLYDINDFESF